MREIFEYPFSPLDPIASDHVDPPAVASFETLLTRGRQGRAEPGLCIDWSVSDDLLVWKLRLRPDATFHSGDPCDAQAVARTLQSCRWGDGWSRQLWYWDPVDDVAVVDGETLEVRLRFPCQRLPALFWGTHTAICHPDRRWLAPAPFSAGAVDGTGPYRVTDASTERVKAVRAAGWPASGPSIVQEITWIAEPDDERRLAQLLSGGAEVVRGARHEWFADPALARRLEDWRFVDHAENSQYYLALDFEDDRGFGKRVVRQAIEAYVDRRRIVEEAFGGRGDARRSPVPVADQFASSFDPSLAPRMSRSEADAALEGAGWERGGRGLWWYAGAPLVIDCVAQDTPEGRGVALALQRQLEDAGVRLDLRFVPVFAEFYNACIDRPAAFISKWLWPDAIEALMGFTQTSCIADSGANWQHASLPDLDRAYEDFLQAPTEEALTEQARMVQAVFMSELPFIPLCAPRTSYAVRSDVAGYDPSPDVLYPSYADLHIGP